MNTCHEIELFIKNPTTAVSEDRAKDWLNHVADCGHCADRLVEAPETALVLIECSHGASYDPKDELAGFHEEVLDLGKVLANRLDRFVRVELERPENIEPLRHEFRHASSLGSATPSEIRCAVAISELSHVFESLVFQEEEGGLPPVTLSWLKRRKAGPGQIVDDLAVQVGDDVVPLNYIVERLVVAISCQEVTAGKLLRGLTELLGDRILSIPEFATEVHVDENRVYVRLVHDNSTEDIAFGPSTDAPKNPVVAGPTLPRTTTKPLPAVVVSGEPEGK